MMTKKMIKILFLIYTLREVSLEKLDFKVKQMLLEIKEVREAKMVVLVQGLRVI